MLPKSFYSRTSWDRHTKTPSGDGASQEAPRPQWKQPGPMALRSKALDPVCLRSSPDQTQSPGPYAARHMAAPVSPNAPNPIARCAHGPVTAAQVDDPPRACLSQDSKDAGSR